MGVGWHNLFYKLIHFVHSALLIRPHSLLLTNFSQLQNKLYIFFPVTDDSVQQLLNQREGAVMPACQIPVY